MEFRDLYEELDHSTEMIRALLAGITPGESQVKPDPESWSFLEVVCHLYDEEREDFREHLDFILHRQDEEWHQIHPQAWITERHYNQQDFVEMQVKFFEERQKSLDWLAELSDADWETVYTSEYGSISAGEMLACWIAHDNLHVRQLVELRRRKIENMAGLLSLEYAGDW